MSDIRRELAEQRDEYLKPTPDRVVDENILGLVSDNVIPRLSGERILELGVGDQVWTPKLVARFPDVTTIDGLADLLEEMERRLAGRPWTPVCSLFEEYRPERPFETVLATYGLEHVDDPGAILDLARDCWLAEGGGGWRSSFPTPSAFTGVWRWRWGWPPPPPTWGRPTGGWGTSAVSSTANWKRPSSSAASGSSRNGVCSPRFFRTGSWSAATTNSSADFFTSGLNFRLNTPRSFISWRKKLEMNSLLSFSHIGVAAADIDLPKW